MSNILFFDTLERLLFSLLVGVSVVGAMTGCGPSFHWAKMESPYGPLAQISLLLAVNMSDFAALLDGDGEVPEYVGEAGEASKGV